MYDLIIVGAGPAGITAAVYAARKRLKFFVISKDIGGQAAWSGDIENYIGYQFITGPDLTDKFEDHMRKYNVELKENTDVVEVRKTDGIVKVKTHDALYEARAVIIAVGKKTRELGVPGEKKFKNKGLTYCATCDGPLFSGKDVAVVGGGNSGLDAALQLVRIARFVYLINMTSRLTGDPVMQEKLNEAKNVKVLNDTKIIEILGDRLVSGIKIKTSGKEDELAVQGIFVEVGLIPNSNIAPDIAKNAFNEIKVDSYNRTSIPGIFAAGDVTDVPEKQIVIAAGEGAKAALGVFRYLNENR